MEKYKKPTSILLIIYFVGLFGYLAYRPNSWNTRYFIAVPENKNDNPYDTLHTNFNLIPHTFFEFGNSALCKYRRGDTVPVFRNGRKWAEMNVEDHKMIFPKK